MTKNDETKKLKEDLDSLGDQLKRALADYANLQRRAQTEKEELVFKANRLLLFELLPIMDLVKKARENSTDPGLEFVEKELDRLFSRHHLELIEAEGKEFDPNLHEAVTTVSGGESGKVAEILEPGYLLDGQVLRPAMVKVFKDD